MPEALKNTLNPESIREFAQLEEHYIEVEWGSNKPHSTAPLYFNA